MASILVTGASRGIGRGIAIELALAGHKVYITGRSQKTLLQVEQDFKKLAESGSPGKIVAMECDHSDDSQVDQLFKKIDKIDILINNAYAAVNFIGKSADIPFHELTIDAWDIINNVGLRNHYRCCHHAANKMVATGSNNPNNPGLIVNISSGGGANRLFNAAYGIGKEAKDRMMSEFAFDLRKCNIYCISLWPGAVKTEAIVEMLNSPKPTDPKERKARTKMENVFVNGESTRFAGRILSKIVDKRDDKAFMKRLNGGVVQTCDIGKEFGIKDVDNRVIPSMLQVSTLLTMAGYRNLANWIPGFVRVPKFAMVLGFFGKRFR